MKVPRILSSVAGAHVILERDGVSEHKLLEA